LRNVAPILLAVTALTASSLFAQKTPIHITADLSEAPRRLYHAEIDLPVKPGPASFITPQWIPGNHAPTGPVAHITGIVFYANGKPLAWRRDDVNLYEYHLTVPAGVSSIHAHLDAIVPDRVSRHLACLEWERLMLYPAHVPVHDILIEPAVTGGLGHRHGSHQDGDVRSAAHHRHPRRRAPPHGRSGDDPLRCHHGRAA
jgi:hypothetical protein